MTSAPSSPSTHALACAALGGAAFGACGVLALQAALSRPKRASNRLFAGIDLGGTTISVGLVDDRGSLQGSAQSVELGDDHTPSLVVQRMAQLIHKALESVGRPVGDVTAFGVCSPGLLDFVNGVVKVAANIHWENVPLTELLAKTLGVDHSRVILEHDANTALLAEVWIGAAQGKKDVVLLTLGTGIGAGILCDGRLLRGSQGEAGELGHSILIPDGREHGRAGVKGIFEAYGSATAVLARAKEAGLSGSSLQKYPTLTCEQIFQEAEKGDALASKVVQDTAKYLAIGCINCARAYDPEMILFTGGMSHAGEQLLKEVRAQFALYHWNIAPVRMQLQVADAPGHAGLIGAAYAARMATSPSA